MKSLSIKTIKGILSIFLLLSFILAGTVYADTKRMTKEELKPLLEKDDIAVLDVRSGKDWSSSEFKIQSAVRVNPKDFSSWENKFPKNHTLVLYCA